MQQQPSKRERINFSANLIEINGEKILSDFIRSDDKAIDKNM